jgi:hypothetical protein
MFSVTICLGKEINDAIKNIAPAVMLSSQNNYYIILLHHVCHLRQWSTCWRADLSHPLGG